MKPKTISEIMTKEVVFVTPEQTLLDVKHIYEKKNFHHHIPVVKNNKLVGMVSLVDFMYHINGAGIEDNNLIYTEKAVKDIMMPNPEYVNANATVNQVAEILSNGKYRALPVVEDHQMIGIVTTADVIRYYLHKKNRLLKDASRRPD